MLTFRTAHQNTTIFMVFRRKVLMNLQAHRAGHMQKVISSFWRWKSTSLTILRKQHEIVLTSDNQYTQNINCRHWIKYSILHHKMTPHLDVIQIKTNWPPFIHTHVLRFDKFHPMERKKFNRKKVVLSLYVVDSGQRLMTFYKHSNQCKHYYGDGDDVISWKTRRESIQQLQLFATVRFKWRKHP